MCGWVVTSVVYMCRLSVVFVGASVMVLLFCFFFQAEDGIRGLVRSRGLGDVYKRQTPGGARWLATGAWRVASKTGQSPTGARSTSAAMAVSYTHLTLPTSDLV
mgnify:CR=1 FL=1